MSMRVTVVVFVLISSCVIEFVGLGELSDKIARLNIIVTTRDSNDLTASGDAALSLGVDEHGDLLTLMSKGLTVFDSIVDPTTEEAWGELRYRFSQTLQGHGTRRIEPPIVLDIGLPPQVPVLILTKGAREDIEWSPGDDIVLELQPIDTTGFHADTWHLDVFDADGRPYLHISRTGVPPSFITLPSSLLESEESAPTFMSMRASFTSRLENASREYMVYTIIFAEVFWTVRTTD